MNHSFVDEEKKPDEDVSKKRVEWQKPELNIFNTDDTKGGNLLIAESDDGQLFS